MKTFTILFVLLSLALVSNQQQVGKYSFPSDFSWGASTSAYQIEGAYDEDGKGISWWDWDNEYEKLPINQTGKIADDFYHRFRQDVALMKQVGLKNFRMSIAWIRVLPNGTVNNVNPLGVQFYNNVFQALLDAGITPWVTLYHGEFPQDLNYFNSTGGWLNPKISDIFNDYADFCFKNFGDKVKNWITLNEPAITAWYGYGMGWGMPNRCTPSPQNPRCQEIGGGGNTATEPYIVAKNLILSHAKAYRTYHQKYRPTQKGQVGLTVNINYALPWNTSEPNDVAAVDTYLQFGMGWYAGPLIYGDYPKIMKEYVTDGRLVGFNAEETKIIKGATDYIGINHYTTVYVRYNGKKGTDYGSDSRVDTNTSDIHGNPIGPVGESDWLFSYPPGIRGILGWIDRNYNKIPTYVLENGFDVKGESNMSVVVALADTERVKYLNAYIDNCVAAVTVDGANLKGYFVWSWMDNFEWGSYIPRFGIVYVDYKKNLTRTPKSSAVFYIQKTKSIKSWAEGNGEYPYFYDEDLDNHLILY